MGYDYGRFVWHSLMAAQHEQVHGFYSEVFGWKTEQMAMADGSSYTMVKVGEQPIGGFRAPPADDVPPHWVNYLSVADVDVSAKAVVAGGGTSLMDAVDVPGVGRMQPMTDPDGAVFFLFHGESGDSEPVAGVGSWHWNELWASNAKAALDFYGKTFGYTHDSMDMPDGGVYYILKNGDTPRAGVMTRPDTNIPAHWTRYVEVDDADAAMQRVKQNGGKALGPLMDMEGVGRFGVVQDPIGASIGLIAPASRKA